MKNINRRDALKQAAMIMGGAISAPVAAGFLSGCTAKPKLNWQPEAFTADQASIISRMTDIILPKTDTPSASELGVPEFIDEMIKHVYTDRQEVLLPGVDQFDKECKAATGSAFLDLDEDKQIAYLNELNAGLKEVKDRSKNFFYRVKEMTIVGYFTTEVGMTQLLQYKLIPAEYKGCISVEEAGGRTWAA